MSDKMIPIEFKKTLNWIFQEYKREKSIFFIPSAKFYKNSKQGTFEIFNNKLETPLGPAAGPHTQLAQNIITSYLSGGRFFELKTVQRMDELVIDKPCIDATDEGYNVEWSQELKIDQSYDEYVKAWILLHFIGKVFGLNTSEERGFVFNMSVGYDLAGIKTERMDRFIEELKDANKNPLFAGYINELIDFINTSEEYGFSNKSELVDYVKGISPFISNSMTLSTMHGCPPHEIEAIATYLLTEKKLNTYVKLNPTLLGFERVTEILRGQGFNYIEMDPASFDHDLQFKDAVPMLKRLMALSKESGLQFGVKLSNTLGVNNPKDKMAGDQMYMSGRSLYPVTITLAHTIASEFDGEINISYSGGANVNNIADLLSTGIYPVTVATVLLKPGGYTRLKQMAEIAEGCEYKPGKIDIAKLSKMAAEALNDKEYHKDKYDTKTMKTGSALHLYDCYDAPCQEACPVHQDVPEYIKLVEEGRYNEAFELIVSKNPLPFITGYICDHQCMFKCTRMDYDSPLLIREIKKIAAENGYDNYVNNYNDEQVKKNKTKAAIIGAGPAGLAAGYFLAKAGFDVMIFDKAEKAGGVVRNVIPEFRLPESAIDKDIDFIKLHGVQLSLGYKETLSVDALKEKGYKYVFIAIGAGKAGSYEIPGAEGKLLNGIEFLWNLRNNVPVKPGKNVAVIGAGNSAMDSARAAKRIPGVENVTIIYRRTKSQMPADLEEYYEALEEGIVFKELLLPSEYNNGILKCSKMRLTAKGADGRRNVVPMENSFEEFEIDTIISAIGEKVDLDFLQLNRLALDKYNSPDVDESTDETSIENVYVGGDALKGPSSIISAVADGKKAAEAIIRKEGIDISFTYSYQQNKEKRYSEIAERKSLVLPVINEMIQKEAQRCLGCDLVCNKCVEVCPNRANMFVYTGHTSYFKDKFQILHLNASCNECGNCETFCPHNGAPYKDKLTLFENEVEYNESTNHGFFFTRNENGYDVKLRIHDFEDVFRIDAQGNVILPDDDFNDIEGFNEALVLVKAAAGKYDYILV